MTHAQDNYNKLRFKDKKNFLKDVKRHDNIIIFFDDKNFLSLHSRNLITVIFEDLFLINNCKPKQIWFLFNKDDIIEDSIIISINNSYKKADYIFNIDVELIENEYLLYHVLYVYYYIVVYKKFKNIYLITDNINDKIKLQQFINNIADTEDKVIIEFYKRKGN